MSEFQVGQEVVKIKTDSGPSASPYKDIGEFLVDGQIYKVRHIAPHKFIDGETVGLKLEGVTRVCQSKTQPGKVIVDAPFGSCQFRPVQKNIVAATVSKGIGVFRKLAADASKHRKITVREDV